jgi:hypothetical protein
LREIKGAIHVHSAYSDGTGTIAEIAGAANAAGIDFCIVTDHDTTEAAERGERGRMGDVLIVVGAEVSPLGRGHCLALGADDIAGYRWMPERCFLHKLRRDGAETYIAHPEGRVKPTFGIKLRKWHSWQEERFTGIEIWSYMHDWVENLTYTRLPYYYLHPERAIDGPDEHVLGLWDRLNMHRRVVGLGALDAHAVKLFFGLFVAFPYEMLFGTVLTHALVDDWGRSAEEDELELRRALMCGRAFISYGVAGKADGFIFGSGDGVLMGDRAPLDGPRKLLVDVPGEGDISIIHNGRRVRSEKGRSLTFTASEPGVYRAEVWRGGEPWIFSNPICLGTEDTLAV